MKLLYSSDQIEERIRALGREITSRYQGKELFVVGVLKGGFIIMADLVRNIDLPLTMDFVRLSSYGDAHCPGKIKFLKDVEAEIEGRDVLIVDDIIDTGQSLKYYKDYLSSKGVNASICVLLDKTCRRQACIDPDYYGFRIDDGFVVGYGLDYAEQYRNLPGIYVLDDDEIKQGGKSN